MAKTASGNTSVNTIKVNLEITGFYYRKKSLQVKTGATVKDVMDAAVAINKPGHACLYYSTETTSEGEFIDGITVVHQKGSAESGQDKSRIYPDGVYEYYDDDVIVEPGTNRFVPRDPGKTFVLAWQYYVYDDTGRDLARASGQERTVVPFSQSAKNGFSLEDGYTIVWRLVQINLKPTYGDSMKVAMSRMKGVTTG